jgi:hypothetical protein
MAKIPKNLSDKSMLGSYAEQITFENDIFAEEKIATKQMKPEKKASAAYVSEFFTPQLQEKVGKALLELKVELYKQGIVDFDIKVARQERQVVLTAVPSKVQHKNAK